MTSKEKTASARLLRRSIRKREGRIKELEDRISRALYMRQILHLSEKTLKNTLTRVEKADIEEAVNFSSRFNHFSEIVDDAIHEKKQHEDEIIRLCDKLSDLRY